MSRSRKGDRVSDRDAHGGTSPEERHQYFIEESDAWREKVDAALSDLDKLANEASEEQPDEERAEEGFQDPPKRLKIP